MNIIDEYNRRIDYLRISITDHCNLDCIYCVPMGGRPMQSQSEILTYEEILEIVKAAVTIGITKIRITGGEPLVRKEITTFCRMLAAIDGIDSIALTTNGLRLAEMAAPLFQAGVKRVNVSLDTLKPDRFIKITNADQLPQVLAGIKKAAAIGFYPIKINMVVMQGINADEIEAFARLTQNNPYHVRFIELMPTEGWASGDHGNLFVPIEKIMQRLQRLGKLQTEPAGEHFGPAQLFALPGAKGKLGFIAPLSRHFCETCNRLRLTADGQLRACLFAKDEIDIKKPLRAGASRHELAGILQAAARRKPRGHRLNEDARQTTGGRPMRAIGG